MWVFSADFFSSFDQLLLCLCFFFSSRRRHTRCLSDWSSDVCSSDLIVMTKLDGTARGGVLVPVAQASDSPIKLIGVGEGIDDLQPFNARAFARSLVGLEDAS